MHIYRFRLILEDHEEIVRDYDIKSNQTFEEFHNIIQTSLDLENNQLASFYMCDSRWVRQKEITLLDMSDSEKNKELVALPTMNNSIISDYIDEPRQRIIYIYDFIKLWSFRIELIRITKAEKGVKYPICVKSIGVLPQKHKPTIKDINEFDELFSNETTEELGELDDDITMELYDEDSPDVNYGTDDTLTDEFLQR